jgi:hypothetical protein
VCVFILLGYAIISIETRKGQSLPQQQCPVGACLRTALFRRDEDGQEMLDVAAYLELPAANGDTHTPNEMTNAVAVLEDIFESERSHVLRMSPSKTVAPFLKLSTLLFPRSSISSVVPLTNGSRQMVGMAYDAQSVIDISKKLRIGLTYPHGVSNLSSRVTMVKNENTQAITGIGFTVHCAPREVPRDSVNDRFSLEDVSATDHTQGILYWKLVALSGMFL